VNWPHSRTTMNRSQNGILAEGQSLARDESLLWFGLPLTVSCFREYSDKKNKQEFEHTSSCIYMQCRAYSITALYYVLAKESQVSFVLLFWDNFICHIFWILLGNFSTMGYCFFYSTFCSLLYQVSVKLTTVATILNTVHYSRGGQQVERDRPVDCRVSVGRSRLILHWIYKIPKKNIFQSIFQKVH